MASSRYSQRPDATPQREREVLADVYAYAMRKHQEKQAADGPGGGETRKGNDDTSRDQHSIQHG